MTHEETLTAQIDKLKRNREKVPLEVLKTKYAAAYNALCESIKDELKHIALQFPPWLEGRKVRREYVDDISEIFNRIYAEGGYSKRLGRLAFKEMEADAAIYTAQQINKKFIAALEEYVSSKACLYATGPCFNPKNPQTPKIYNDFLRMFWDDDRQGWREPEPGEMEPAILIFLNKGGGKRKNELRLHYGDYLRDDRRPGLDVLRLETQEDRGSGQTRKDPDDRKRGFRRSSGLQPRRRSGSGSGRASGEAEEQGKL